MADEPRDAMQGVIGRLKNVLPFMKGSDDADPLDIAGDLEKLITFAEAAYEAVPFPASPRPSGEAVRALDLRSEAAFLVARLDEWSNDYLGDKGAREWMGHVDPSIARLRDLVSAIPAGSDAVREARPISDAPRDGTVLLFGDSLDNYACGFWNNILDTWQFDEDTFSKADHKHLTWVSARQALASVERRPDAPAPEGVSRDLLAALFISKNLSRSVGEFNRHLKAGAIGITLGHTQRVQVREEDLSLDGGGE